MNWNQRFIRFIYTKSYSSTSCIQYTSTSTSTSIVEEYRLPFDVYVQAITFSPSIYTQILFESKPKKNDEYLFIICCMCIMSINVSMVMLLIIFSYTADSKLCEMSFVVNEIHAYTCYFMLHITLYCHSK